MDELLMRNAAPLSAEIWHEIDETVEHVARQQLVGRRFISLVGPLGVGAQTVPTTKVEGGAGFHVTERGYLTFTPLGQDFTIAYEELVAAQQSGLGLELGPVALATAALAKAEDELIFAGLKGAKGAASAPLGEWEKSGGAFAAVAGALEKLISAGVYGPYALVLSPSLYTQTQRIMADSGLLEISQIRELVGGNVYFSPALKPKEGLLIANAPYNVDLVVAQDMVVAYTANVGLDHTFRLMEKLALRVKRPAAICVLK
jgi:uncharacterized linocin/CFP29 family protein